MSGLCATTDISQRCTSGEHDACLGGAFCAAADRDVDCECLCHTVQNPSGDESAAEARSAAQYHSRVAVGFHIDATMTTRNLFVSGRRTRKQVIDRRMYLLSLAEYHWAIARRWGAQAKRAVNQ